MFVVRNALHVSNKQTVVNLLLYSKIVKHDIDVVLSEFGHPIAVNDQFPKS